MKIKFKKQCSWNIPKAKLILWIFMWPKSITPKRKVSVWSHSNDFFQIPHKIYEQRSSMKSYPNFINNFSMLGLSLGVILTSMAGILWNIFPWDWSEKALSTFIFRQIKDKNIFHIRWNCPKLQQDLSLGYLLFRSEIMNTA